MVVRAGSGGSAVSAVKAAGSTDFVDEMVAAYDGAANLWFVGASVVYERLADEVVALAPASATGPVLDLCAGTGAASTALLKNYDIVIALDRSPAMLAVASNQRPPAVTADALAMPFRAATFGLVVMACGLNHAPDPAGFLTEAARVTRPGGTIMASTFDNDCTLPSKAAVDDALNLFGFRPPWWHERFKADIEPATSNPSALLALSTRVGLAQSSVTSIDVAMDLSIEEVVAWRFSMASHASFIAGLSPDVRHLATVAATRAVRECWVPVVIPLLVLSATR